MSSQPGHLQPCYLVEWYHPDLLGETLDATAATLDRSAESLSAQGFPVRLLTLVAVPADDVLLGVLCADSASVARQTCDRAGLPAQRLTPAARPLNRS